MIILDKAAKYEKAIDKMMKECIDFKKDLVIPNVSANIKANGQASVRVFTDQKFQGVVLNKNISLLLTKENNFKLHNTTVN